MTKDLTPIYKKYKGRWVALDKDYKTVIASGNSAKLVYQKAKKKSKNLPRLFKVPSSLTPYIG